MNRVKVKITCGRAVLFITFLLAVSTCIGKTRPQFLAHYMPWYQTPEISGYWGWHWTMNHFNPEKRDPNGRREIASHYYPLTGPYDSQDMDILEYQCLLMKISGIDGVIVDWYGMEPFWDYGVLNESTHALFDAARRFKLSFAVCYEDQSIKHMVENGRLSASEALAHGKQVMWYLQNQWFGDDAYLKLDGRPVLLVFGPQYFTESSQWTAMFADLPTAPLFFTEDNRLGPAAVGAYPWPPMWKSNAQGILTQEALDEYLNLFYAKAKAWPYLVAGAFAGFRDIYKQAGVGAGDGVLDHRNGEVFRSTLQKAMDNHADVIQLVTWNDYGEGTMIE
ncbi:MAG: glycoside hydrolase family 71/99-like protein, partial [candidate division KSB1 bacterium]|nr:glycoside hydrolase family 71/99-like protein [candidate division KSB1 bacterium]